MLVDYQINGYLGRADHNIITATLAGPGREEESMELVPDWGKVDFQEMNGRMEAINWRRSCTRRMVWSVWIYSMRRSTR